MNKSFYKVPLIVILALYCGSIGAPRDEFADFYTEKSLELAHVAFFEDVLKKIPAPLEHRQKEIDFLRSLSQKKVISASFQDFTRPEALRYLKDKDFLYALVWIIQENKTQIFNPRNFYGFTINYHEQDYLLIIGYLAYLTQDMRLFKRVLDESGKTIKDNLLIRIVQETDEPYQLAINKEFITACVQNGASLEEAVDIFGLTSLANAVQKNFIELITFLLELGANINTYMYVEYNNPKQAKTVLDLVIDELRTLPPVERRQKLLAMKKFLQDKKAQKAL